MNRGLHDLASSIKRKVAAVFAPVEPKPHRSGLFRRTLLVTAMGLFAGAAALGMVQQPDRSEIPPTRVIQSILPLTTDQVEMLKSDNVAEAGLPGLAEAGVTPTAVEAVIPSYLYRYRKGGQYAPTPAGAF